MRRRNLVEAVTAGLGAAAIPYVSLEGGSFTLLDSSGNEKPIETKYFDCVIIDSQIPAEGESAIQRVFWGERGTDGVVRPADGYAGRSGVSKPPLCFSDNGVGASVQAQDPQSTNCTVCQWKQFNFVSKVDPTKRSTACRPVKKLAVLPMEAVEWDTQKNPTVFDPIHEAAFLIRIPVMSHDNLAAYGRKFKGQDFDITQVITRVSFVHGSVGLLDFNAIARVDDENDALIDKICDSHTTDVLVGRGDKPIQQLLAPPKEEARPLPPLPPPSAAAPQAQPAAPAAPFATAPATATASPSKRTRKPKAEAAPAQAGPFAPAQDGSIPPFLQRSPAQGAASQTGIAANPPAPPTELNEALNRLFK